MATSILHKEKFIQVSIDSSDSRIENVIKAITEQKDRCRFVHDMILVGYSIDYQLDTKTFFGLATYHVI